MRVLRLLVAGLGVPLLAGSALAAAFDGSRAFTCRIAGVASCTPSDGCEKESAETVNLPPVLTFDVPGSTIAGIRPNGERLETKIEDVRHVETDLALQGVQGQVAWSITVANGSGAMTLAAIGEGIGYLAFGSCASSS